jgi:fructose-1,6-bisphosphatase II / sedoheptulose-1,7-bisphosphatase
VAGVISTTRLNPEVDIYMGIGGAPEGVLAAAALQAIGGQMMGRLLYRNDDERGRAERIGISDFERKYSMDDLAHGDVVFAATGVTTGTLLDGVQGEGGRATTHSVVMSSATGTLLKIRAEHNFARQGGA